MAVRPVGGNESFVSLIRTALEDEGVRGRLRAILSQPPFHRHSLLNTLVADLKMQQAPTDIIRAIACLLDDEVAEKARELLDA